MAPPTETKEHVESTRRDSPFTTAVDSGAACAAIERPRRQLSVPLRRMRGAIGLALLWGTLWITIGVVARLFTFASNGAIGGEDALIDTVVDGVKFGMFGGVAQGVLLAATLRLTQRNARKIESLSRLGVATGGASVAIFVDAVLGGGVVIDEYAVLSGALGAAAAIIMLQMARRKDASTRSD